MVDAVTEEENAAPRPVLDNDYEIRSCQPDPHEDPAKNKADADRDGDLAKQLTAGGSDWPRPGPSLLPGDSQTSFPPHPSTVASRPAAEVAKIGHTGDRDALARPAIDVHVHTLALVVVRPSRVSGPLLGLFPTCRAETRRLAAVAS